MEVNSFLSTPWLGLSLGPGGPNAWAVLLGFDWQVYPRFYSTDSYQETTLFLLSYEALDFRLDSCHPVPWLGWASFRSCGGSYTMSPVYMSSFVHTILNLCWSLRVQQGDLKEAPFLHLNTRMSPMRKMKTSLVPLAGISERSCLFSLASLFSHQFLLSTSLSVFSFH